MKKVLTLTLVLALTLSLLTACGGGSGNSNTPGGGNNSTTNPPASDSGGSTDTPSSTPAKEPSGRVDYDQVLLDANGVKVTLTGYEHKEEVWSRTESYFYHYYYFTIENNSDKRQLVQFTRASVNGCMVEVDDYAHHRNPDPGETYNDAYLYIPDTQLETFGITDIYNFELRMELNTDFISEPISLPAPAAPASAQTFDNAGVVLLDQKGIKITAIRADHDFGESYDKRSGVWLFLENNSGGDVKIWSYFIKINGKLGFDSSGSMSGIVANNKVAFTYLSFKESELKNKGINKIEELIVSFVVDSLDEKDKMGSNIRLLRQDENEGTVKFDANGKAVK